MAGSFFALVVFFLVCPLRRAEWGSGRGVSFCLCCFGCGGGGSPWRLAVGDSPVAASGG